MIYHKLFFDVKDCNNDGVTDCDDYAMLHFNLKDDCSTSLQSTNFGLRYSTCRPTANTRKFSKCINFFIFAKFIMLLLC